MSDYAKVAWHLLTCSKVLDCATCELNEECVPGELYRVGSCAIEELMAQVRDKDFLIQQQADEIERLRRDVKKQQEKMIELAKKLPKRSQWTNLRISAEGTSSVECILCGATIHNGFTKEPNYCPNCGAKMGGTDEYSKGIFFS